MLAWLQANPAFLVDHPHLYDVLDPPCRVHGPNLADHMQAMVAQARTRAQRAEHGTTEAAAHRRAAEGFARRVQSTVLALMRAPNPAWLATHELASLLQVDAARLCAETETPPEGLATIPRGTIAATLGQRAALVRPTLRPTFSPALPATAPDAVLHGEAVALAAEEALVRVPLRAGPALLAIACRDAAGLEGAGTDALTFLGQAVAAALETPT